MNRSFHRHPPPLPAAIAVCLGVFLLYAVVRLYVYSAELVPLTYSLPLLLMLWHQNRRLNAAFVVLYSLLAATEVFVFSAGGPGALSHAAAYAMMLVNIGTVGLVMDLLVRSQQRLATANERLEGANFELEASNEELAAREEEISSQNEELQRQTEELEQQMEEVQQQSERMHLQTDELQRLSEESVSRQRVLQSLLEVATTAAGSGGMTAAADRIGEAAIAAFGGQAAASLILARRDGQVVIEGHSGIELHDLARAGLLAYEDPFSLVVMQEGRPAAIEDLEKTPEVIVPPHPAGAVFRSALAAPIRTGGESQGALVVYSTAVRHWTEADFKAIDWLSAQAALVLLSANLQEELAARTRQAEEATRRKTRFLAAVSHDVRTPANGISLLAELIKRAGENPRMAHEVPELAESLRTNAKLLVELVSDVLDLSRFDSGRIDLEETEFCLDDVIQAEVTQHRALSAAAGLTLVARDSHQPIWLRTDRMKLARVLGNLIGNAIKFTDTGTIEVRYERAPGGHVEIQIVDTGVGIHPDHLDHIFDEFYQINNPARDRSKGTGLGLAICKRLIDAIGCSLTVQSHVGKGTTFTIRIPEELTTVAVRQSDLRPGKAAAGDGERLSGVTILVVEDHEATRTAVAALLASEGATIEQAADGRAALRVLCHHELDVVLLDLMLPDMDGREILEHLRSNRPRRLRCVLAVSGDVTEIRRQEVESLGADGLLPKPVQIEQLVERICSQLLKRPRNGPQKARVDA
jgi:signal transduction histidine kinase/ActR/RegA family two-component response regulator